MEPDVLIAEDSRVRVRAGMISLAVAVVLLGAKYQAYLLTGSTAILSDALGDIAVMGHKNEYKQHQHHTDPKDDRNVHRVVFLGHWQFLDARTIP